MTGPEERPATGDRPPIRRRAARAVMTALPGDVVERGARAAALLSRYGGRSRKGARTLSRAVELLAEPPRVQRGTDAPIAVGEIAARVGRSDEEVQHWADAGLLGAPEEPGPPPAWGRVGLDRARLVDHLKRAGLDDRALEEAARDERLPLLAVDAAIGGRGTMTLATAAERAGVSQDFAAALWRALGMPPGEPGERLFNRRDVEALRIVGALTGVYSDDDLLDTVAVIGRGMAMIAGAQVELFRRRVAQRFLDAGVGELEWALRSAAFAELMIPPVAVLLELAHRRHFEAAARAESVIRVEEAAGSLPGQVEVAVGFADLVGFTAASERLSPLELGEMASGLLRSAEGVFHGHGARLVKTIGDAVMFVARDPTAATGAALALRDTAASVAVLPQLRVGIADGPVLRRSADYFGRTVNVAARLCAAAPPGGVLVLATPAATAATWESAGARPVERVSLALRGIAQPVEALRMERA